MPDAFGNQLLDTLVEDDAALLRPMLEHGPLESRFVMVRPNVPIRHVYFMTDGVASVVSHGNRGRRIESGLLGRDGMSATSLLTGIDRTPLETFVQIAGAGYRIAAQDLTRALDQSPTLRLHLLRFAQVLVVQTAFTAMVNGHARIEERLARWLLMCHDRLDGDDLPITHEYIALMLGVRRAGVSVALKALERRGLIAAHRGGSTILNRKGMETLADGFYGTPEAEYKRLFG